MSILIAVLWPMVVYAGSDCVLVILSEFLNIFLNTLRSRQPGNEILAELLLRQ